jgi:hypothetical protein
MILRGVLVPEWLQDGVEFGEESPVLEVDLLMVRVANLRAKSLALGKNVTVPCREQQWKDVATEAQELDAALVAWSRAVPEGWKFSTHPSPINLDSPGSNLLYNGPVHIYTTHGHATIWNRYRAIRLIVNSIRNRALSNLLQFPWQCSLIIAQLDLCQRNINSVTNDLCGSVPFFFNSPDSTGEGTGSRSIRVGNFVISSDREILPKMAILLAWPLAVAVSTDGVPEPQRQWLRRRLKIVANSVGDAILESVAEQAEFRF